MVDSTALEDKALLSVKEMCAYLSIGQTKCRELLSNPANGFTVRIGNRLYAHKKHLDKKSFTSRYNVENLVYFEATPNVEAAIAREKQIKSWNRKRKNKLIESKNPNWVDLYEAIL